MFPIAPSMRKSVKAMAKVTLELTRNLVTRTSDSSRLESTCSRLASVNIRRVHSMYRASHDFVSGAGLVPLHSTTPSNAFVPGLTFHQPFIFAACLTPLFAAAGG
ncbi:hypothetical protein E1B28_001845 [Marasmius oreades]|uniref:Uncharacterized protein n=1 Tax=Marasmius oreades TaxID=181124 RepID=A0A9P7V476_9AGAR|nr:uncharacterized protein E1B28_001845 [Marasmius oreades]KAG7100060.1 hypothetical protein E1B28_001845 [Marasmius oreades]